MPSAIRTAQVRSLAKINLDLRILHKRPDGFHELRSVFQTISLHDTIRIDVEPGARTAIELDDPLAIPDNLVRRAAERVLDAVRKKARVRIALKKTIPMGGGLGGGSSNAAAILLALPVLLGKAVPDEKLREIALSLGSDVPFFLLGGTALGLGRGEELYPLPEVAAEPLLVAHTGLHVATGSAYQALGRGLTFEGSSRSINSFQLYVRALADVCSARAAFAFSANDFEAVVFRQNPLLKRIRAKLSRQSGAVRMTGSGSALFAIYGSAEDRERALEGWGSDRPAAGGTGVLLPASLVNRAGYRRLWRKQLRNHLDENIQLWPPRSRYEQ
jgi:4-diphosphocytidyl-2-C-methyl-D-erythritol kinase